MATSIFADKASIPDEQSLAEALGRSSNYWNQLKRFLSTEYAPLSEEWKFYSYKSGWSLKVMRKKRTILYMIPCKKHFWVTFVLGDKAKEVALKAALPASVLEVIRSAKKYMEGTGFSVEVRVRDDLATVEKLAAIKMAN